MRPRAARRLAAASSILLAACAPALASRSHPTDAERRAVHDEIGAMLIRAAASWNRGDLDAFVSDYLPGDSTTYIGSRGVLRGPAAIRAAYAPRFAPGGTRDSLSFVLLDVDPLAPNVANVVATYVLARHVGARDSVTAKGPTSLVMRRVDGRWRIVHDHSS
ncbi:MAG: L-asparaginase [Gemmatimonadetes bacterium]|nr:L-asparaginase [Gemmatimonadota bacterium]